MSYQSIQEVKITARVLEDEQIASITAHATPQQINDFVNAASKFAYDQTYHNGDDPASGEFFMAFMNRIIPTVLQLMKRHLNAQFPSDTFKGIPENYIDIIVEHKAGENL